MRIKLVLSTFTILFLVCFSAFSQNEMVRMIYFHAKDDKFDETKETETQKRMENLAEILTSFYKGLNIEKENGDFKVHFIESDHDAEEYEKSKNDAEEIMKEVRKKLDSDYSKHVYLIATNVSSRDNVCGSGDITLDPTFIQAFFLGKSSVDVSWAVLYENTACDSELIYYHAAHELGHAFGLLHDFRNRIYIMSYGTVEMKGPKNDIIYHTPYESSKCTKSWIRASRFFADDPELSKTSPPGEIKISEKTTYNASTRKLDLFLTGDGVPALHQVNLYLIPSSVPNGYFPRPPLKLSHLSDDEWERIRETEWEKLAQINKYSLHNCCIFDGTQTSKNHIVFENVSIDSNEPDNKIIVRWIDTHGNVSEQKRQYNVSSPQTITIDPDSIPTEPITSDSTQDPRLRYTLKGHTDAVSSVTYSPNGRILVSGSMDETIRIWDPDTGEHTNTLTEHTDGVTSVAFSADGNVLASVGWDNAIHYWDPHNGKHIISDTHTSNRALITVVAADPVGAGNWFASGGLDNIVRLWHGYGIVPDPQVYNLLGHTNDVSSLAFSADAAILASGSYDNTVKLWNVNDRTLVTTLREHSDFVTSVAFSPDGQMLASGSRDKTIRLWNIANFELITTLEGHSDWVLSLAFSPDGKTLASGCEDKTIRLWDVTTHKMIDTFLGHTDGITTLAFSPDRRTLASTAGRDNNIYIWDLSTTSITAPTVRISPSPVISPPVGDNLVINIDVSGVENFAGYQVTVQYDPEALKYMKSENGQFLPVDWYFAEPVNNENHVTIAATSLAGESDGDTTLATLTFEVLKVVPSDIILNEVTILRQDLTSIRVILRNGDVVLSSNEVLDVNGDGFVTHRDLEVVGGNIGKTGANSADVNRDGVVDIRDLLLVASAITSEFSAPSAFQLANTNLTAQDIQTWLSYTFQLGLNDVRYQRGIAVLQQLLIVLTPKQTALLPNYPNPFNPETWIPYQLASPSDVRIDIYTSEGKLVRALTLGPKTVGVYQDHTRAAYWDGRNTQGELVASGVYFYTFKAGDFTATRKMLIMK